MFKSPSNNKNLSIKEVVKELFDRIKSKENSEWTIAVGTDSQNAKINTKFCTAIILLEKGKGGIYFYKIQRESRHHVLQNRMLREAEFSINTGKALIEEVDNFLLEEDLVEKDFKISFEIHCDLGQNGKSQDSIKAAIGWITAEFGETVKTKVKPESTAASSIADKYTRRS